MPEEWNRDPVKDFLFVRPFFTPRRLRLVWLLFLIVWTSQFIIQAYVGSSTFFALPTVGTIIFLTSEFLWRIFYLILVRLLLEIALVLLSKPPQQS